MHFFKHILLTLLFTFSALTTVGCSGGEADYSFEEVGYIPVLNDLVFITQETKVIEEALTDVLTVTTSTEQEVQYSIIGGADADLFTIDPVTGKLSFKEPPVYIDGGDNNYEVTIEAQLNDGQTNILPMTITIVQDLKTSEPIIDYVAGSIDTISSEGVITQILARPADATTTLTYTLTGQDAAQFIIDTNGNLTFNTPLPVYDNNPDRIYELRAVITDGYGNTITTDTIYVKLVENPDLIKPVINSESFNIVENTLGAAQIEVTTLGTGNVDSYMLSGSDAALFTVTSSGLLHFNEPKDYETLPNSFTVNVQVGDDKGNLSEIKPIIVNVADIDETFVFQAISNYTPLGGDKYVATITALPKTLGDAIPVYSVVQSAAIFEISAEGVLQFIATAQKDQSYSVQLQVESQYNGSQTLSQLFTVTVVDDPSKIAPTVDASYSQTNSVESPINTSTIITTVSASVEGNATVLIYSTSGADADKFSVDDRGNLTFNAVYDYEAFADDNGDNIYEVVVDVRDDNGNLTSSELITVQLLEDPNKIIPVITSSTFNLSENDIGDLQIQVLAEGNGVIESYSIVGGPDASLFDTVGIDGVLSFISAPDYEIPLSSVDSNSYHLQLQVSDDLGNTSATKEIIVNVLNVDESLTFTSLNAYTPVEESTFVGVIAANANITSDAIITYSIVGGSTTFSIDAVSGELRFIAPATYDINGNNTYTLNVEAQSQYNGSATISPLITVTVAPTDRAITFSEQGVAHLNENTVASVTIVATSASGEDLTYAIEEGGDTSIFSIHPTSGLLTINVPAYRFSSDLEANVYRAAVVATDSYGNSATQQGELHVNTVDGIPRFTSSAAVSVDENVKSLPAVSAYSPIGSSLLYTIDGGADSALFTITSSGILAFTYAHNFEDQQDQNRDNVYEVNVRVTDTQYTINTAVQSLYVTVNDVSDAPSNIVFFSTNTTSVSVQDGYHTFFVIANDRVSYEMVIATPSPSNGALTYSITGNPDPDIFSMTSNGELKVLAPPVSSDQLYTLTIEVNETNGEKSTQTLNVTISN